MTAVTAATTAGGRERDREPPPLAARDEPEQADAAGRLGQERDDPGRGPAQRGDDRGAEQDVDVAEVQVGGDDRDDEERQRPGAGQPQQREADEQRPERLEDLERQRDRTQAAKNSAAGGG